MLDAISGPEVGAPYQAPLPARPYLEEVGHPPGRLRIAFTSKPLLGHTVDPDCVTALAETVALLESLGHEVVEAAPPVNREEFNRSFLTVVCGEVRADMLQAKETLGRTPGPADVEFTTWALNLLGKSLSAGTFVKAERYLRHASRAVGDFFENVDVLVTPTMATPPFKIGALQPLPHERATLKVLGRLHAGSVLKLLGALEQTADKIFDFIPYPPLFNVTGQPAMSVPLHWTSTDLPVGSHFVGRYGDEATLFRLAAQLEQARPWVGRRPPVFA
jgi:amidase